MYETLSYAYLGSNTAGFFSKNPILAKILFSIANVLMALATALLGQWATSMLCINTAFRLAVSSVTAKLSQMQRHGAFLFFGLSHTILIAYFWKGTGDFLPLALGWYTCALFFYASNFWLRVGLIGSCLAWALNGFFIENWQLIAGQIPGVVLSTYLAYRLFKERSEHKA